MIEVKTQRLCNFCGKVVRDDDTYSHGECVIDLAYTRCYCCYDYSKRIDEKDGIDICSDCLAEIKQRLTAVDDRFKEFLK